MPLRLLTSLVLLLLVVSSAGRARAEITGVEGGVQFTYDNSAASQVHWAGDFNGWSTTANPFTKDGELWVIVLPLPPGEHMYKLVVDGQWVADPNNPDTKGEFGNSLIRVGADGKPQAGSAGASGITSLSPKIKLNGRLISRFESIDDPNQGGRFELRRPDFDLDLDFNIRMSDVLDARVLTNIRAENEDVPFWQSRLNFDRGHLHLHSDRIDLLAFDNDRIDPWPDPLRLVGNVGIYDHDFGYDEQGMLARKKLAGFDMQLLYADNFRTGGTDRPGSVAASAPIYEGQLARAQPLIAEYDFNDTDNNKDVLAYSAGRKLGRRLDIGVVARLDRGFNPGFARVREGGYDTTGFRPARVVEGPTLERWSGAGGHGTWSTGPWKLGGEYLWGRNHLDFQNGSTLNEFRYVESDTTRRTLGGSGARESFTIATDQRANLSAAGPAVGLDLKFGWELHTTRVTPIGNDSARYLDNRMTVWSGHAGRTFPLSGERAVKARLGLEFVDFDYDAGTPWRSQFWFDSRNFWLEAGEHEVKVDRFTLLGGDDVVSWQPSVSIDILADPPLNVRYAGTINSTGFDLKPKFIETLFQATLQLSSRTRLYSDTRWARYDDPVLQIDGGYLSTFLELQYQFTPGIQFALSWGVDPYVIDEPVNEYAYIGRDTYLFDRFATGAAAANNYYSLYTFLPLAEQELEDERRIQLEAIVRF
ncbi:MAG: glycogen-binding domain-containing protein [Candidatus Eisenbacteria bacterium]|nr:glycogen-binding domain-containing protein [Candidatus Eisenbacteria bacterium]